MQLFCWLLESWDMDFSAWIWIYICTNISMAKVKWIFIFHFHYHWHRTMTTYIFVCLHERPFRTKASVTYILSFVSFHVSSRRLSSLLFSISSSFICIFSFICICRWVFNYDLFIVVDAVAAEQGVCGDTWHIQAENCFHYKPNELGGKFSLAFTHTYTHAALLSLSLCTFLPPFSQVT